MFALCRDIGLHDHDDRIRLSNAVVDHPHTSSNELTSAEMTVFLDILQAVKDGTRAFTLNTDGQVIGTHPHDHNPGTLTAHDVPADPTLPL
jgi:hypothetical protein